MIIAIPYENGNVFQHFGKTPAFALFCVEDGKVTDSEIIETNGNGHGALAGFLAGYQVNVLLCGGIGAGAVEFLMDNHITVYPGNEGKVEEVLNLFLSGNMVQDQTATCHHHDHGEGHHECHCHDKQ